MKSLALLLVAVAVCSAAVVTLTDENFDATVDGSKNVFVKFYAPWCGHCKSLAPAYEVVGDSFGRESSVVIAKIDCDTHKTACSRFDVKGYPTLKYFPKGETKDPEVYNGGRTAEDIVSFVNGKAGTNARVRKAPSYVVDLNPTNFEKFVLNDNKHVFVEFYAPWCGHCKSLAPVWEKLAAAFANEPEVTIAKLDADAHKDLGSKYGVSGFPTLKWFTKSDKTNPESYDGGRDLEDLVAHVNQEAGTSRGSDGRLTGAAGVVQDLSEIAGKFFSTADDEKDKLTAQAAEVVSKLQGKTQEYGHTFVKLLALVNKKGAAFVETEIARVEKLLTGALSPAKTDELTIRKNLLATFRKAVDVVQDAVKSE